MPSVKIRVESVSNDEFETQKQGEEPIAKSIPTEKLAVASIFAHQAISTGKQIISTGINNIGNFTGDYVKQDQVQHDVGILTDIATIATGALAGNWIGAVIATIGVGTKHVINAITENQNELHRERETDMLRQRAGASTTNGSRTNLGDY